MSDIAKSLTKAVIAAEERAGTMPAKEAVKLRPSDWHTLCKTAREAATEITRLRQLLSEAEKREREERVKALNHAAVVAYATCAETRHVTLGDKVAAAIRALQSEER